MTLLEGHISNKMVSIGIRVINDEKQLTYFCILLPIEEIDLIVNGILAVSRAHFFRAAGKGIEAGPYALNTLAISLTYTR